MAILGLTPILYTDDIPGSIEFYTKTLGFECSNHNEDDLWARIEMDEIQLFLSAPNEHIPFDKSNFTGTFYFLTDDIESLWKSISKKAEICYPLETFEYGMKEFAVYDNNGYTLQFGQDITE